MSVSSFQCARAAMCASVWPLFIITLSGHFELLSSDGYRFDAGVVAQGFKVTLPFLPRLHTTPPPSNWLRLPT